MGFPEDLVQQFRTIAIERLDRIEQAWGAVMSRLDQDAATTVHRELHTLKGESRMLGFSDINLVCHKLEDMLEVARARGYAIDEDFDLAVNMALRFMAMLVRKKVGTQLGGIDLPGFIKQIDGILAELRPEPRAVRTTTGAMAPMKINPTGARVPRQVRARLGAVAVDAFVEYAVARERRRDRLRASWHAMRELIGVHRAVIGAGQLAKHETGVQTLAKELGKQVAVRFELAAIEATTEILGAVDTAVLHLLRNAVDHGIGVPAERTAAGKPPGGTIRVHTARHGQHLVMTVSDDGSGVNLDDVRRRAIERGLLPPDDELEENWLDIVCQPGFTTRVEASDISGRGVGLYAVRSSIQEVGGTLAATTRAGSGTTWTITIPLPEITIAGWMFRAPNVPFPIIVDRTWALAKHADGAPAYDLAHRLGLVEEASNDPVRYFQRDGITIGVVADRMPEPVEVRRLVSAPLPACGEIVVTDVAEGLLLHPDRLRA